MPKATDNNGLLQPINCTITVPLAGTLKPRILPEITDSKSATYNDENVIGRSFPIKTYAHSDNRMITMVWHIVIIDDTTKTEAVKQLKAFQSCVYPQDGTEAPYGPPQICTISCGEVINGGGGSSGVCVVLRSYSVSYPTDVAWDADLIPYKFDINLQWEVVYATSQLPGASMIIK